MKIEIFGLQQAVECLYNGIQLIRLGTDNVLHSNQISQLLINSDGIWMCVAVFGL